MCCWSAGAVRRCRESIGRFTACRQGDEIVTMIRLKMTQAVEGRASRHVSQAGACWRQGRERDRQRPQPPAARSGPLHPGRGCQIPHHAGGPGRALAGQTFSKTGHAASCVSRFALLALVCAQATTGVCVVLCEKGGACSFSLTLMSIRRLEEWPADMATSMFSRKCSAACGRKRCTQTPRGCPIRTTCAASAAWSMTGSFPLNPCLKQLQRFADQGQ